MSTGNEPAVIGVGASAGGVESLLALVAGLETDLTATILVVLHQAADAPTVLPDLLGRRCALPVRRARDGDELAPGCVFVAPPDHHLLVDSGRLAVTRGPKEHGHRPGVDPLFRSLALEIGPAAVGVVLTGMLDDGAAGLLAIVRHGGTAVVQDPEEAMFDGMPRAALEQVPGAVVATVGELPKLFAELGRRDLPRVRRPSAGLEYEVAVSRGGPLPLAGADPPGSPAGLSCPDCSGPLFDLSEDRLLRYRCRVGHAWSQESLGVEQDGRVENALYSALQALEEKATLQHRIAERAETAGHLRVVAQARDAADQALRSAGLVRDLLTGPQNGDDS